MQPVQVAGRFDFPDLVRIRDDDKIHEERDFDP